MYGLNATHQSRVELWVECFRICLTLTMVTHICTNKRFQVMAPKLSYCQLNRHKLQWIDKCIINTWKCVSKCRVQKRDHSVCLGLNVFNADGMFMSSNYDAGSVLLDDAAYMAILKQALTCYNSPLLASVALGWVELNPKLSRYIHFMSTTVYYEYWYHKCSMNTAFYYLTNLTKHPLTCGTL